METSATVFGISADNAREIGKWLSYFWIIAGIYLGEFYTFLILIANMLHFNHELVVWIG